jgi:hypothetical protein
MWRKGNVVGIVTRITKENCEDAGNKARKTP